MDTIDRHLQHDEASIPSPELSLRIMAAVRREAAIPPPIRFPWERLAAGFTVCAIAVAVGYRVLAGSNTLDASLITTSWTAVVAVGLLVSWLGVRMARVWSVA